jgi:hypothetical protein
VNALTADRIHAHASRLLLLPNHAEQAETLAARPVREKMGYLEFLDFVLEQEVGLREGRGFQNALKLSGLPHHKSLDSFEFAFPA